MFSTKDFDDILFFTEKLYKQVLGFVRVKSSDGEIGHSSNDLLNPSYLETLMKNISQEDAQMSLGTYRSKYKGCIKSNLLAVTGVAFNINPTSVYGQSKISISETKLAFQIAVNKGFPEPTYLEYSHGIRAVYLFDYPYIIKKEKRDDCCTFLERIATCLSEELNRHTEIMIFNAKPIPLTGFIRIPHSLDIQKKWDREYNYSKGKMEFQLRSFKEYPVEIDGLWETWDVSELAAQVFPPLFEGYEEWKENKKKRKKRKMRWQIKCAFSRLEYLETLQNLHYDEKYREKMCYFYFLFAMNAGFQYHEAIQLVYHFNAKFDHPLDPNTLISRCLPRDYIDGLDTEMKKGWNRLYKDVTIREILGLGDQYPDLFPGSKEHQKELIRAWNQKKREEREKEGKTKKADIQRKTKIVVEEREKGKKWKEIAEIVGVSIWTVKRYYKIYKEEQSASEHTESSKEESEEIHYRKEKIFSMEEKLENERSNYLCLFLMKKISCTEYIKFMNEYEKKIKKYRRRHQKKSTKIKHIRSRFLRERLKEPDPSVSFLRQIKSAIWKYIWEEKWFELVFS